MQVELSSTSNKSNFDLAKEAVDHVTTHIHRLNLQNGVVELAMLPEVLQTVAKQRAAAQASQDCGRCNALGEQLLRAGLNVRDQSPGDQVLSNVLSGLTVRCLSISGTVLCT